MEAKLKEYRALRRRKELIENTKNKIEISKQKFVNFFTPKFLQNMGENREEEEVLLMEPENYQPEQSPPPAEEINEVTSEVSDLESIEDVSEESWRYCLIKWSLYAVIWLTLFIYFLKLQFGAVFFVISVLIGIYFNTRTRPRKRGEVSAYSVFNENCVSIDGTLKPEQFEKEIRYGAGTVRSF